MQAFQRAREVDRKVGWRTSGHHSAPGVLPWVLAVIVVAAFGVGLHFLYQ